MSYRHRNGGNDRFHRQGGDIVEKKGSLVGKISGSGVQHIKAPVEQNKKTGKSSVKKGTDLRTKK